jgi:Na+/melibiose symporter-like transporter
MAIVNNLSASNRMRDRLANNRNGLTFGANITVLTFALIFFHYIPEPKKQFRYLCFIALGLGLCTSMFYMCSISEVKLTKEALKYDAIYRGVPVESSFVKNDEKKKETKEGGAKVKTVGDWVRDLNFYIHGIVYMLVRIAVNVTMTM